MKKTPHTQTRKETIPVVLIHHAQSQCNLENRFTGWADPPLTAAGIAEAHQAGKLLREPGCRFDAAYSSRLQRARITLDILLEELDQQDIPQQQAWQLNERHYGALQGMDKTEATVRHGQQQVWRWRRGYEDRAEALQQNDPRHPLYDPLHRDMAPGDLPDVENLVETRQRMMTFWKEQIVPRIRNGERLFISTHGNTLWALIVELAEMSVTQVEGFEISPATPIVYHFDQDAKSIDWCYLDADGHQACA
jgi:2,3-bisphosphoglycerate-dependent phosphoglycerate mutase